MSGSSSSPRFRIRLEDGSEVPIDSVEGLARRLARGDLLPDTPLHDASTGEWREAGKASVVQFILEEIQRGGDETPPGWEDFERDDPQPPSEDSTVGRKAAGSPDETDPLDLGLTIDDLPALTPESHPDAEQGDGPEETRPEREDPWGPEFSSRDRSGEWLTPSSAGGLFTTGPDESEGAGRGREEAHESPERSVDASSRRLEAADRTRDIPRPRKRKKDSDPPLEAIARNRRPQWLWLTALVVLLAGAVVGRFLLGGSGAEEPVADGSGSDGTLSVGEDPLVPPPGLAAPAERAAALVSERFQSAVDSIRIASDLPPVPPETWLSGYYLANAAEFPAVREFWAGYDALVEAVRLRDRSLFLDVVRTGLGPDQVDPTQRGRLESYLRARYASTLPARRDHYDQLGLVAVSAVALHDFLVERSEDLEFTPAVGPSVPRDPVLEVGTGDAGVQRELEFHLDELFRALDRSRGGGPPSLSGLRNELYGGFGEF